MDDERHDPDETAPPPPSGWPRPGTPPPPQPGVHGPSGGPYGGYPGYRTPETDGTAVGALVAAIASWIVCPVITAIVALVLAGTAERNIAESRGWKTGAGLVTAARIVAWINIGLVVALLVFALLVAAASAS